MKARLVAGAIAACLLLVCAGRTQATTWGPKEVACPICQTKNTLQVPMSYGSYIYRWPSKYQYIFWPSTDRMVLHCCQKCGLTCFMWDFPNVPKEKHEEVKMALAGVSYTFKDGEYYKAPMSERLAAAEKVYEVLNKDDDEFWCMFYRVAGYHLEEGSAEKAAEARKKALELAEKMLKEKDNKPVRKELLLISGAMRHLLKDDRGALADFDAAKALKYQVREKDLAALKKAAEDPDPKKAEEAKSKLAELEEGVRDKDQYLTELLDDYVKKLRSPQTSTAPAGKE